MNITFALQISGGDEYEIHLKHPPNSCFFNNYSPVVLVAWQANMDIQLVFNHHRCVTYVPLCPKVKHNVQRQ